MTLLVMTKFVKQYASKISLITGFYRTRELQQLSAGGHISGLYFRYFRYAPFIQTDYTVIKTGSLDTYAKSFRL